MITIDFSKPKADIFFQFDTQQAWQEPIFVFLANWLNENIASFQINTSGSTGTPKTVSLTRSSMIASARRTNAFFGINQNAVILCALPVRTIGGRMMLVRAQLAGAKVLCIPPASLPDINADFPIDFASFTPMQVFEILQHEEKRNAFAKIKNVIIGGGKTPDELQEKLREFPNNIYETFGMTETVSHIALRKITEQEFACLPEISVKKDDFSRLQILFENNEILTTNDIVEIIDSKHFRWISRADDVINTGGIKIFAHEIETKLKPHIPVPFFITKITDEKFGEKVVLVIELTPEKGAFLPDLFARTLTPFEKPKQIFYSSKFVYSEMGKLMKQASLENAIS